MRTSTHHVSRITFRKSRFTFFLSLLVFLLATGWAPVPRPAFQEEDVTEDSSVILVTQLHIFMTRVGQRLQVEEHYLLSNTGDQTYVGVKDPDTRQRTTLTFTLPVGAEGLIFESTGLGERYLELEGGFADTEPIPPGTATVEVQFGYELSYHEGGQVERALDVPVASVVLLLSGEGVALEGQGIMPAGALDTTAGPALSYTAGPLEAGEPLIFALVAGRRTEPVPAVLSPSVPVRNTSRETAIGLVALAAAVMVIYLLWRSPAPGPLPARARPLVENIVALDADFEAGQMREETYRQQRKALKRRIYTLLSGGGGAGEQGSRGAEERRSGGDGTEANTES